MKRDVCDRCLKVNTEGPEFSELSIVLAKGPLPHILTASMSICPECEPTVIKIITERIMLTDTPADVRGGTHFMKGDHMPGQSTVYDHLEDPSG